MPACCPHEDHGTLHSCSHNHPKWELAQTFIIRRADAALQRRQATENCQGASDGANLGSSPVSVPVQERARCLSVPRDAQMVTTSVPAALWGQLGKGLPHKRYGEIFTATVVEGITRVYLRLSKVSKMNAMDLDCM